LLLAVLLCGCTNYFRSRFGGPQIPERPNEPYIGTGAVWQVKIDTFGQSKAMVDFGKHKQPRANVYLLVVRNQTIIGQVKMGWCDSGGCTTYVLEGEPESGDMILGVQHRRKLKRLPLPTEASLEAKEPTGKVVQVVGRIAWVEPNPGTRFQLGHHFLVARTNAVVGKIRIAGEAYAPVMRAHVVEGTAANGDLLLDAVER
jgi:hypothetical protein